MFKFISKYWHPKNTVQCLLSTFVGLLGIIFVFYEYQDNVLTFTEFLEGVGFFGVFAGLNLTNRNDGSGGVAIAIIILFIMQFCTPKPIILTNTKTDSVFVVQKIRYDTTIFKSDSAFIYLNNPCLEKPKIKPHIKKKVGKSNLNINTDSSGGIKIQCLCQDYIAIIQAKDTELTRIKSQTVSVPVPCIYEVPWYDKACRAVAIGSLIFGAVFIFKKT